MAGRLLQRTAARQALFPPSIQATVVRAKALQVTKRGRAAALLRGQRSAELHVDGRGAAPAGSGPHVEGCGPRLDCLQHESTMNWKDMGEGSHNLAALKKYASSTHSDRMALRHIMTFKDVGSIEVWECLSEEALPEWDSLNNTWKSLAEAAASSAEMETRPVRRMAWHLVETHFRELMTDAELARDTHMPL